MQYEARERIDELRGRFRAESRAAKEASDDDDWDDDDDHDVEIEYAP